MLSSLHGSSQLISTTTQEDTSFPYDAWHTDKDTEAQGGDGGNEELINLPSHVTENDGAGIPIPAQAVWLHWEL